MNQVEINKQAKLSEHITLGEMTRSKSHPEVYNIPSREAIGNLKRLCAWLEELRYRYNTRYCQQPGEDYETSEHVEGIIIISGYRSPELNRKVCLHPARHGRRDASGLGRAPARARL